MPRKKTPEEFITDARAAHGEKFDYSQVVYTSGKAKVVVVCPVHGAVSISPEKHLSSTTGCPKCGVEARVSASRTDLTTVIAAFVEAHGQRYDYSAVRYAGVDTAVNIICREHGMFAQTPWVHKAGHGCPKCALKLNGHRRAYDTGTFALKAATVHDDKYTYGEYAGSQVPIQVTCATHGTFTTLPTNHLRGSGCPVCARQVSAPELAIMELVQACGATPVGRYRPKWMGGKELDVYVPEFNLAIEYCGHHVHNSTRHAYGHEPRTERYHYDKWKTCRDNGVTLLTIYDFEWMSHREKWEAVIRHKLQKADRRVYARKCQIVPVERDVAYRFCKDHHIESAGGAWTYEAVCKGLTFAGELVAIMVADKGDIKRACTLSGTAIIGGVSRLFKSFPTGTTMMTTNNTGSSGNYGTLVDKTTLRYWWVRPGSKPVAYPRRQCQKHMLEKRFGQPVGDKTERQYMEDLGHVKCYDSGLSYWVNS